MAPSRTLYSTCFFLSIFVLTTFYAPIVGDHAESTSCGAESLHEDEPTALLQTYASLSTRASGPPTGEVSDSRDAGIELAEARMKALSVELSNLGQSHDSISLDMVAAELQPKLSFELATTTPTSVVERTLLLPANLTVPGNVTRFINYTEVQQERERASMPWGSAQKYELSSLRYFISALVISLLASSILLCCFSFLRRSYPLHYSYHSWAEQTPFPASKSLFGWVSDSARLKTEDVMRFSGLDTAMFLRYTVMCVQAFGLTSVLMILVYLPLHSLYGIADASTQYLLSIDDLGTGIDWIWWVHSIVMCLVVVIMCHFILSEMNSFLPYRFIWLQTMPFPRSNTVLVENIPLGLRSETRLKDFFNRILNKEVVQRCMIVRDTGVCRKNYEDMKYYESYVTDAEERARRSGKRPMITSDRGQTVDEIAYYTRKEQDAKAQCEEERRRLKNQESVQSANSVISSSGFVTFITPQDTLIARKLEYAPTTDIVLSVPPDPSDVIYTDLLMNDRGKTTFAVIGGIMLVFVFALYLASVTAISYLAKIDFIEESTNSDFTWLREFPIIADVWNGAFQSIALTAFLLMLATFLSLILNTFFVQISQAWAQYHLQRVYFGFLFFVAIVFNCLGETMFTAALPEIATSPAEALQFIVTNVTLASCFYVKFMPLQMVPWSFGLIRVFPLFKFCWYRRKYNPALTRELSEPEDPSLYGIGSRSAYLSFLAAIVVVLCQISPLAVVIGYFVIGFARLIFGYMLVFTETRKPDLGGVYFVQQLHHLFLALHVYVILMAGYITFNSDQAGPAIVAWAGLLYSMYVYFATFLNIQWEYLPAEEMELMAKEQRPSTRMTYLQPELEAEARWFEYNANASGLLNKLEDWETRTLSPYSCFGGSETKANPFTDFMDSWVGGKGRPSPS